MNQRTCAQWWQNIHSMLPAAMHIMQPFCPVFLLLQQPCDNYVTQMSAEVQVLSEMKTVPWSSFVQVIV